MNAGKANQLTTGHLLLPRPQTSTSISCLVRIVTVTRATKAGKFYAARRYSGKNSKEI